MRLALLGSTGYVGSQFSARGAERGITIEPIRRASCDIFDPVELSTKLRSLSPHALINCAGYTGKPNVDACEADKANCLQGNAVLPGVIAKVCAELDIPWGQVSSGCIYTGRRSDGDGFDESDPPNFSFRQNNCSFYSGTKALGEEVLQDVTNCYIWRLRIPFSNLASNRNYLSKMMRYDRLLDAENSLSQLDEFVDACFDCIQRKLPYGIYNLTNPGSITTREVVSMIQSVGLSNQTFEFFDSEEDFMAEAAITPRSNCVLSSQKAIAAGLRLTEIRQAILAALQNWQTETHH